MAPLAIGVTLMVMVYAGGPISGGHYNPAVTTAVTIRGKCPAKDFVPYILAQLLGAFAAAQLALFLTGASPQPAALAHVAQAFVAEAVFTFALAWVVLNVATSAKSAGNSYFGLAIGGTVIASAYAIGGISGCALNPAVALGAALMGLSEMSNLLVIVGANLLGGALAALSYRYVNCEECK
jgi:aquaporin Z